MKPSEILEKAAAHMERVGLNKGSYFDQSRIGYGPREDAPCCALGAILMAHGGGLPGVTDDSVATRMLRRVLRRHRVDAWNDAPERTQAEVVAKLREAAELARAEGK